MQTSLMVHRNILYNTFLVESQLSETSTAFLECLDDKHAIYTEPNSD